MNENEIDSFQDSRIWCFLGSFLLLILCNVTKYLPTHAAAMYDGRSLRGKATPYRGAMEAADVDHGSK